MTGSVWVVNGPNLNLLGQPVMSRYGSLTLDQLGARCASAAAACGLTLEFHQSNHEGVIVDHLQAWMRSGGGLVINAGALAFSSIAIAETVGMSRLPSIELHMSNTHARGDLYRHSLLSSKTTGLVFGLGAYGYEAAISAVANLLRTD